MPFDADVKVGGMIEIPAAVLAIGAFLRKLDFLSIGTNDLIQYTLAVDRSDEAVSHLYDPLHPAVLRLIGLAIGSATKAEVPIAVCGEMAGEPQLTRLLLGLGLREFSMHPSHLLGVKQRVLQTDVSAAAPVIERHAARRRAGEARTRCWRSSTPDPDAGLPSARSQRCEERCGDRRRGCRLRERGMRGRRAVCPGMIPSRFVRSARRVVAGQRFFRRLRSRGRARRTRSAHCAAERDRPAMVPRCASRSGRLRRLLGVVVHAVPALVPVDECAGAAI